MGRNQRNRRHLLLLASLVWGLFPTASGIAQAATDEVAAAPDPADVGPFAVTVAEYQGGPMIVSDPDGLTYPAEIHGVAHYPTPGPGADGPFPLVVYLHGNHGTCAVLGGEAVGYPCPDAEPVIEPVPSYRGYDYLGDNLASHGYVTVSIDANAINTYNVAGDKGADERAQLIGRTLDHIAGLSDGTAVDQQGEIGDDLLGRVDLDHIGLMGHSRGGEGVTRYLTYNETRTDGPSYQLDAVFSLAGTDYNLPRASGTNFGTLLPLCDGDVYDLQSVFANDRSRFDAEADPHARHVFTVGGTDHNFYNSAWLNDDNTGPGKCSTTDPDTVRLSRSDTERMGLTFVNSFMRRYVGGETAFEPLLTGEATLPDSACPAGLGPCDGLVGRTYLAPAAHRLLLVTPTPTGGLTSGDDGRSVDAIGLDRYVYCHPLPDGGADGKSRDAGTASTCDTNPYRSRADALTLAWRAPAVWSVAVDADVTGYDALTFKAAANFDDPASGGAADAYNPGDGATDLQLAVVDADGATFAIPVSSLSHALTPMLPDEQRKLTMNGVFLPLRTLADAGLDLTNIARVELRMGGVGMPPTGSIQIAELAFQDTSSPNPTRPDDEPGPGHGHGKPAGTPGRGPGDHGRQH